MKWLVIGVSGVTCGGKTTVAKQLKKMFPSSYLISQDDYFWPVDSKQHTWIPELNNINWEIISSIDMEKMLKDINNILECGKVSNLDSGSIIYSSISDSSHLSKNTSFEGANQVEDYIVQSSDDAWTKNKSECSTTSACCKFLNSLNCHVMIIEGFLILNYKPIAQLCNLKFYITLTKGECYLRRKLRTYDPPDVPGYFELCIWPEYEKHFKEVVESLPEVHFIDGTIGTDTTILSILKFITDYLDTVWGSNSKSK